MTLSFQNIPFFDQMIHKEDNRIKNYLSDSVMCGSPDAVYRAENIKDLKEIFVYCNKEKIPITFCGSQTSLTGSSVAEEGLLVSTEKMNKIVVIDKTSKKPFAVVQPGIFLSEFQEVLDQEGLFYPPDPTSRKEARLGATVATNATGEDSLLYGSTRCYIRSLKLLLADGTELTTHRPPGSCVKKGKNEAGYYLHGSYPIDLFIGSEGTLGLITEITVDLLPRAPDFFSVISFFSSLQSALNFVVTVTSQNTVIPRCLEIMDEHCLEILRALPKGPAVPLSAKAAIYFKQEYDSPANYEQLLNEWFKLLTRELAKYSASTLLEDTIIAMDRKDKENLREFRHAIPSTINERVRQYQAQGGGKVSSDWWIPIQKIEEAISKVIQESQQTNLTPYLFGHIGNGHPHVNYITRTKEEKQIAQKLILGQCQRAVAYGGGVAGEHGIGKLKHNLLKIQHSPQEIKKMVSFKKEFDPHWILGRNNLFSL